MESRSKINETFIDEFHKQEAERTPDVRILACSILILGLIVAGIFIYCVRHYQRISVKVHARVAEGGLYSVAACLVPFLVFFLDGCKLGHGGGVCDWACLQKGEKIG